MQPENDESTGTAPSGADIADTGSVAPDPQGEVADSTPDPQEQRAEGVAESGAGSKDNAGTVSSAATAAAEEQRRPLLAGEELDGFRDRWDAVQVDSWMSRAAPSSKRMPWWRNSCSA